MKFILEFLDFSNRESSTRTKSLNKEEFLEILKNECSQFSFDNDQLYRRTNKTFGKFGLFMESERKGTIGKYSYSDFFDIRKDYPVPRYKSLIGSTSLDGAAYFGSDSTVYLVIPFNNSEIVFAGSPDLALWSRTNEKFRDDLFILEKYKSNFKVPLEKLENIRNTSTLSSYTTIIDKYGFEFFTNANCLLIDINEIEWLKNQILIKESWDINKFNRNTYKKYITYDDLNDIMFEILDDFPELEWYIWNSENSSLIKDKKDNKSFIIELANNIDNKVLYYLEPKIWNLISNISNKLDSYNLYVSGSDFGESDTQYEIVVSEIGHRPIIKD
jgi:hypothetical protein